MRYSGLTTVLIVVSALCLAGCGASKSVMRESAQLRIQGLTEQTARDSVMVELRDTLKEVTTVTVQLNETGDTVKVSTVTDRTRASDRSQLRDKSEKLIVRVDTVYVERRDSVLVKNSNQARASPLLKNLKWIFWIVVGLIALTMVLKIRR